jgi:hypothetical protein
MARPGYTASVNRPALASWKLACVAGAAAFVALSTALTTAGSPSTEVLRSVDTGLCPFALSVQVTRPVRTRGAVEIKGPTTITLRNRATGKTAVLHAGGSSSTNTSTGDLRFSGRQLWLGPSTHVPYLTTGGKGSQLAPRFVVSGTDLRPRVVDPCALVAGSPPSTAPAATRAPWGLPRFVLSQIDYARLTPVVGSLVRHDHVHLDLVVNGRKVTIPAGVGQAEPVDDGPGPCPRPPAHLSGDCAPGHFFAALVALSPLHPHTTSGIIHIESDRPAAFTLGQFFDEWGVRFSSACLGSYCTGDGKELRVFVDGRRVSGNPRKLVLGNHQEIAVVFGGPRAFTSVPAGYTGRWPTGCGGRGEPSCFRTRR